MITQITEAKILRKHNSCDCKCKFEDKKYHSNKKLNNSKC